MRISTNAAHRRAGLNFPVVALAPKHVSNLHLEIRHGIALEDHLGRGLVTVKLYLLNFSGHVGKREAGALLQVRLNRRLDCSFRIYSGKPSAPAQHGH